jgi:hypothetical protein
MSASGRELKGAVGWGSASWSVPSRNRGKGELEAHVDLTANAWRVAEVRLVHHFQVKSGE